MSEKIITHKSELLGEEYAVVRHSSGLPIYVFPKRMSTSYALFATDFGAVDNALDAEGKVLLPAGVAHFLEHKLFSNEDGSDSFERFSELGADANAYTSQLGKALEGLSFQESGNILSMIIPPPFSPERFYFYIRVVLINYSQIRRKVHTSSSQ